MAAIGGQQALAQEMKSFANSIRQAITKYGIVDDPNHGYVYAYEVDGFGSRTFCPPVTAYFMSFSVNNFGYR